MPSYAFVTLDVFTERRFGGNPLAIFTDARGLDAETMQSLARELNLSEVVFLLPPERSGCTARLRIFTSAVEIGFAGHPNVGTAWLLAQRQPTVTRMRLEQGAGVVDVDVERSRGALVRCTIAAPSPLVLGEPPSRAELADCAGLREADLGPTRLASVGLTTVCVAVDDRVLGAARCNAEAFRRVAARRPDLSTIFLLCLYARDGGRVRMRVFAPLSGTQEDPATGSAAAALTAALLDAERKDHLELDVVQGIEIDRPSRMHCVASKVGQEIRAWVGGACVPVITGEVLL